MGPRSPKRGPRGSKMLQDAPRWARNVPEMAPRGSKKPSRWAQDAPRCSDRRGQGVENPLVFIRFSCIEVSATARRPRASQERPGASQERPESDQERPKNGQQRLKSGQEPAKNGQEPAKSGQERPKNGQEPAKSGPRDRRQRALVPQGLPRSRQGVPARQNDLGV